MKKDKKWAQKEVDKYLSYEGVSEARNALIFAKGVIDQLDEPEVLSQEWIERNTSPVDDEGRLYVWKRDLQNAIVPKPELPVVPRVVADYITHKKKSDNSLAGAFVYIKTYGWDDESSYDYEVYEWLNIDSNDETFARAWLDGYEVEGAVFPRTDTIIKEI